MRRCRSSCDCGVHSDCSGRRARGRAFASGPGAQTRHVGGPRLPRAGDVAVPHLRAGALHRGHRPQPVPLGHAHRARVHRTGQPCRSGHGHQLLQRTAQHVRVLTGLHGHASGGGVLLAIGVNKLRSKVASYFVRTSLFFPFVISWAAVALLWKYVLDPSVGMGTYYMELIGLSPPNWFTDPQWALPAIIGIDWWHTVGFTFVIMLAGLQTVPEQLYEAARIDGANAWQRMWNVTIPMMSPTIFFASVITFIGAFQIFDPIQIITPNGGPEESTLSIVMYLYQQGFQAFQAGYASAVALVVFVIMALVTALQFWISRKWVHEQ